VRLVFPRSDDGDLAAAREARPVTLASLGAAGPAGNTGGIGGLTRTLYSTALATYVGGSLTNDAALTALAAQAAADWYAWQAAGAHDVAFAGVAPWVPTGADGFAEYAHAPGRGAGGGVLSRFRRDTYFDQQADLFHWTADLAPPAAGSAPPFSGACVLGSPSTQSCLNNTYTNLTWAVGTLGWDTGGYFTSGLPTRLTVPAAGKYRVDARFEFPPAASGKWPCKLDLVKNGVTDLGLDNRLGDNTYHTSLAYSQVVDLASGDYLQVQAYQLSGFAVSAQGAGGTLDFFFAIQAL
jgi:hypothetical protein